MNGRINPHTRAAFHEYLLALADDELILGHRDSQWCGHAPIIEADIAFANIALDEIGHASALYALLAELEEQDPDRYPDRLVYFRSPGEYRCTQLVEHPNRDWAFSMLRQFLFDALEIIRLPALAESVYVPLSGLAAKILAEERYHHRHTHAWVRRLSLGTEESHSRMQSALNELWPLTDQLFIASDDDPVLVGAGLVPDPAHLRNEWDRELTEFLITCDLQPPQTPPLQAPRSEHSPYLEEIIADLQKVSRQEPEAQW